MYLDRPRQVGPPADSSHSSVPVAHVASLDFFRLALCRFFLGGGGESENIHHNRRERWDAVSAARSANAANFLLDFIHSGRGGDDFSDQNRFFITLA